MPTDAEIRSAAVDAVDAVTIAASQRRMAQHDADRTLAYYLRGAIAHGLTVDEVCEASQLERDEVLRLTDPAGAH